MGRVTLTRKFIIPKVYNPENSYPRKYINSKIHKPESAYTRNFHIPRGTQNWVLATVKLDTGSEVLVENLAKIQDFQQTAYRGTIDDASRISFSSYGVHSYRCPGRSLRISRCLACSLHSFWYQVDLSIDLGIRVDRTIVFEVEVCLCIVFAAQIDLSMVLRFQVDPYILLAD